jgi:hypothetical protein
LYNNKRDPNEHYGRFWGRNGPQVGALASWDLNDQAPVARAYLYTGAISEPPPSAWSVDAGGDWSNVTHWTVFKPNLPGATAVFGNKITAPRTITVDMPITVGRIDFASANAYTIAGNNTLTLDATTGDAQINVTSGNHAMNTAVSLLDNTVITVSPAGSTLSMTGAVSASSVNVTKSGAGMLAVKNLRAAALVLSGGTMVLQPDGGILTVRTLSIAGEPTAPAAMLDLTNGSAIVDYPNGGPNPETTLRAQIISGRGGSGLGKTWNAAGITSSQAAADPVNTTSVGYANNATMPLGSMTNFRGQAVDPSTVLIRYTRTGDANLDGIVNNNDVTIVGSNYAPGIPKPSWAFGDFDYNGFVDNDDVTLLGVNYNPDASPIPAPEPDSFNGASVVPEPEGFTLLISASAITLLALIVASWIRNRAIMRSHHCFRC